MQGMGPRPPVVRRGTSRAVPVVVSAGLAVGVFCGLMFGLGTEKETANAATSSSSTAKGGKKSTDSDTPADTDPNIKPPPSVGSAPTVPVKTAAGGTPPATGGTPPATSGTPPATGGAAGSDAPGAGSGGETAAKTVKVTVEIKPDSAAQLAKVTIDGKDAPEGKLDLDLEGKPKKDVKVVVKAIGFRDLEQNVEIEAGNDTKVQVELARKRSAGTNLPRPEGTGGKKPGGNTGGKKPGGGLIDI